MTDTTKPGDPRFFVSTGPHEAGRLAALIGATVSDTARFFSGVAPLQSAGPEDVSFLDNRRYAAFLDTTQAGAVIVHPDFAARVPKTALALVTPEPYVGWAKVLALFFPPAPPKPGIHPSAVIDPTAILAEGVEIGAGSVIGARAKIGENSMIGPLTVIGDGVVIGKHCRIHAHVTLSHAILGDRVTLYPGARIGQDGFGFAITKTGFTAVPQLGRVLIEDGAEIGANVCIDRGSAQDTVIGAQVRVDNLVQLGHNVKIGHHSVIIAQAGISGSTSLGAQVMVAAQAGLTGHLTIGDGARIGAQAGVMQDVPPGQSVIGSPAQEQKSFFREVVTLRKLAQSKRTPKQQGSSQDV